MANNMLIVLTTGPEDRGNRATLALVLGVASAISGVRTTIYLTMSGAFWSREPAIESVHIGGFEPLRDYVRQFLEAGGTLEVCSPCNECYCSIAGDSGLIPEGRITGLAHVVDLAFDASVVTL